MVAGSFLILVGFSYIVTDFQRTDADMFPACGFHQFHCDNNKCIDLDLKCNNLDNCGDNSDEINCGNLPEAVSCQNDDFSCLDRTQCVLKTSLCDGEPDCKDSSDETVCVADNRLVCHRSEFLCHSGECIPKKWVTDHMHDCRDGSDEINVAKVCNLTSDSFLCKNKIQCISKAQLCDDVIHCTDASDEGGHCASACENVTCDHACQPTPSGGFCSCQQGYAMDADGRCNDINECNSTLTPPCSQVCINRPGTYICSCQDGYGLRDDHICVPQDPEPVLVYSESDVITSLYLDKRNSVVEQDQSGLVRDLAFAPNNTLLWVDGRNKTIYKQSLREQNGGSTTSQNVLVDSGLVSPRGLAVDWVTQNVYIADGDRGQIIACTMTGDVCSVVLDYLDNPCDVVLDSELKFLWWTDMGSKHRNKPGYIGRSWLDGSDNQVFLSELSQPTAMILDRVSAKLFWVNEVNYHSIIEAVGVDGTNRQVILSVSAYQPVSLAVLGDDLYWTDRAQNAILKKNKFSAGSPEYILNLTSPTALAINHPVLFPYVQNIENPCLKSNCSHLCLQSNNSLGYKCFCPLEMLLASDQRTCQKNFNMPELIAAGPDGIFTVPLIHIGDSSARRRLFHATDADAAAVDYVDNRIVYFDVKSKSISMATRGITGTEEPYIQVLYSDLGYVEGIAVDWSGRNIFWTDYQKMTVEVGLLDGSGSLVLIQDGLNRPRGITLDINAGLMFFSDWGSSARVEKCHMDGTNCDVIVNDVGHPNSLSVDTVRYILYWSDSKRDEIGYCNYNGNNRGLIPIKMKGTETRHPFGLVVSMETIYFTDLNSKKLHYIRKSNVSADFDMLNGNFFSIALWDVRQTIPAPNACTTNHGSCAQFCLATPGKGRACKCKTGWQIHNDSSCTEKSDEIVCDLKCEHGGICVISKQQVNCSCTEGYFGHLCESKVTSPTTISSTSTTSSTSNTQNTTSFATEESSPFLLENRRHKLEEDDKRVWIAGLLLGVAVLVIVILALVYYFRKYRPKQNIKLLKWIRYKKSNKADDVEELIRNAGVSTPSLQTVNAFTEDEYPASGKKIYHRESSHISVDSAFVENARGSSYSNSSRSSESFGNNDLHT